MAVNRKKRGRRRNRGRFVFLYKMLSAVVILAAIVLGCIVFFRVGKIEVTGQSNYTTEQVIQASGISKGDNLFQINKFKVAKQILSRMPYVDELSIYRKLPDTLVIQVVECKSAAAVQGDGAWWVLDTKTKMLERTDEAGAAAYPPVTGLTPAAPIVGGKLAVGEEQTRKLESFRLLLAALDERNMVGEVKGFDLSAENVIEMKFTERFTVKMPMSTDFHYAMRVVRAAVDTLPQNDQGVIDLTREEYRFIPYGANVT